MNHSLKRLIHGAVATVTALGVSTLGLASSAFAGQLTAVAVTPTVTTAGTSGVTFNIAFKTSSASAIQGMQFLFSTTPSDAGGSGIITTGAVKPTNFAIAGTPTAVVTSGGSADANFSVTSTVSGGNVLTLTGSGTETPGAGNAWTVSLPGLTLPNIGDCNVSATNTDTCYVRIITLQSNGTTIVDQAVGSFTFTSQINLTATVDPYMTFAVSGVNSNWTTFDANAIAAPSASNIGTAITTTTGTSIPFGNVTVGQDKFAMQQLDVRTNASAGYSVYQKSTTDNNQVFKGTFQTGGVTNHIDSFTNGSSWNGAGVPTATAWTEPTGLTNTLSGWLALQTAGHTGNAAIGANWVGPVVNSGGTGGIVKSLTGPDNGITGVGGTVGVNANAGTSAYVVYRVSVDAYQPADSYTGTMQYNVVANY